MNLHFSQPLTGFPSNSSQNPIPFLSLTPCPTNRLMLPSFSPTNTQRRISCSHHPSLSPKSLSNEPSESGFPTPVKIPSTFASNAIKRLSVFPTRSNSKKTLSSRSTAENPLMNPTKTSSSKKEVQPILKAPIIGFAERFSRADFWNSKTPSIMNSSFSSMSSEKFRAMKTEFSSPSFSQLSFRNRQKPIKTSQVPEKVQLSKVIRRKSCHCSDCGGLSKKEKTHMNVVELCSRVEQRNAELFLKLSLADSKDESGGLGSNRSNKSFRTPRKSYAFRVTPRSLNTLQPRKSVMPGFQTMKTMTFGGMDEARQSSYSLSKFAMANKCCTLNVLHDESEDELSRKNTLEKINKGNRGKSEISEFMGEDQGTRMSRNSIEEMGEVQTERKRRAVNIPSLDLDLQQEGKKNQNQNLENEEEEQESIMNDNPIVQEKKVTIEEPKVLRKIENQELKHFASTEAPQGELKKVRIEKYTKTIVQPVIKKDKKYLSTLDLKTERKGKDIVIKDIYTARSNPFISGVPLPFKSPKSQLTSRLADEKIKNFFESRRKMTMDTLGNMDGVEVESHRKSQPSMVYESARKPQNGIPYNMNYEVEKKGQSLSARKPMDEKERQEIALRLRLPGKEQMKVEKTEKNEFGEKGLKPAIARRRRVKTLVTGELKKIYKLSIKE